MTEKESSGRNGHNEAAARHEQELTEYLQRRIRPGLNSGAIPLLARSIAKHIAEQDQSGGGAETPPDFEADMHELQAELGKDWILRFSVHGDDAWLTADKADGSGQVDAQTADELVKAVRKEGGDRSS